jgi:AmmeMemoRadiSam system protein B
MPFVKHYFPNSSVVEIVYSNIDYTHISKVVEDVLKDEKNFVIISTDLSHFHNLGKARLLDDICLQSIINMDINKFDDGCEACGLIGVKGLVKYASQNSYKVKFCDYRTSADITNDNDSVVGYTSFVFGKE